MVLGFSIQQKVSQLVLALSFTVSFSSFSSAQSICMVTADFQTGEDYIIYWEPIQNSHSIDSVKIYRKQGVQIAFSHIGSVAVGINEPTTFTDFDAMTYDTTKYAIAYLYSNGQESDLSLWHQAVVMNYNGGGEFVWTKYKIQNQTDESYIGGYQVLKDNLGLGSLLNSVLNYLDILYILTPSANYVVEVELPSCDFQAKANIHTSRSNIKQQISNPATPTDTGEENETGEGNETDENLSVSKKLIGSDFTLFPNPTSELITISTTSSIEKMWISSMSGSIVHHFNQLDSKEFSFSTKDLENGIYFVNLEVNNVITTKRIVVSH